MSNSREWKGQRIGPYRIGERYSGIPEDEGQLHEAHHVETGAPAVAVIPAKGEDWRLPSPWSLRTTNFPAPGVLIVDAEPRANAQTPTLAELARGAIHTAGALASLDARETAQSPFTRKTSAHSRHRPMRWGAVGAGLVLAAGLALIFRSGTPSPTQAHPAADGDEPIAYSDGRFTSPTIAYPMPEKPHKEQRRPPCLEGTEVELRGGCWLQLAKTAPCPRSTAEYQGKCYMPTRELPEPNSAKP